VQTISFSLGDYYCSVQINAETNSNALAWKTQRHCNAQYELHASLKGDCIMDVEDKTYLISPSDALLVAPGFYHCSNKASDEHLHFVVMFSICDAHSKEEVSICTEACIQLGLTEFEVLLCRQTVYEEQNKNFFKSESIKAMYKLLLSGILRKVLNSERDSEKSSLPSVDKRFGIIDNFFEQNLKGYGEEEALAGMLNLSVRQLNRVLKKHYGMCFREKLSRARMDRAGWLLNTTEMPINKICEEIGYLSETSFYKAFKRHYKMSPSKYRTYIKSCR